MKIIKKSLIGLFLFIFIFLNFTVVLATNKAEKNFNSGLVNSANEAGYDNADGKKIKEKDIAEKIGTIIGLFMSMIGLLFMVLIFMGAFDIVGAGGNEEQLQKGKKKIKNGGIGILIMFSAYILAKTILDIVASGGAFGIK